jgi:amicyanin
MMGPYGYPGKKMAPYAGGYQTPKPAAPAAAAPAVATQGGSGATAEPAASASVSIAQMRFAAPTVTVKAGGTVTWTNNESVPHTVTAQDGSFGSAQLGRGDTFSQTFTEPGTYSYYCAIHPNMRGTVVVVG